MVRQYVKSKYQTEYKKRITWLKNSPLPIVDHEYLGTYDTERDRSHGNTTIGNPGPYIRMNPMVSEFLKVGVESKKRPEDIYTAAVETFCLGRARNKRQVNNARYLNSKNPDVINHNWPRKFADQIAAVQERLLTSDSFKC